MTRVGSDAGWAAERAEPRTLAGIGRRSGRSADVPGTKRDRGRVIAGPGSRPAAGEAAGRGHATWTGGRAGATRLGHRSSAKRGGDARGARSSRDRSAGGTRVSFELIFVNDGSRDRSAEVLRVLVTADDRVQCAQAPTQLRKGGRARHRVPGGARCLGRDPRRGPSGRPGRDSGAACEAVRRTRRRQRVEAATARPARSAPGLEDVQRHHTSGLGNPTARLQLRAEEFTAGNARRSWRTRVTASSTGTCR